MTEAFLVTLRQSQQETDMFTPRTERQTRKMPLIAQSLWMSGCLAVGTLAQVLRNLV